MEITTETTEEDHVSFYKEYGLKRNWLAKTFILVIVDMVLSAFSMPGAVYLVNFIVIGALLFLFFYWIPYLLAKARFKKEYNNLLSPTGQKTYRPFAIGIEIEDDQGTTFLRFENVKQAGQTDNFIFFIVANGYYLLPKWCFSSVNEANHFLSLSKNGIASAKGVKQREPLTFKPAYLVGLICLIPLIGAIAGVILIILGIAHYKDRVFIIIGAIGILITVAVYGSLFYSVQNSDIVKDGFARIAQSNLNDLVKNIEFYKLQNGTYPDSLQQVVTKDSFTSIYDPSQVSFTSDNQQQQVFQYHKKGNKYLLFSVGKDGKPYTADDIYPTITGGDTSKMGFIRKR